MIIYLSDHPKNFFRIGGFFSEFSKNTQVVQGFLCSLLNAGSVLPVLLQDQEGVPFAEDSSLPQDLPSGEATWVSVWRSFPQVTHAGGRNSGAAAMVTKDFLF